MERRLKTNTKGVFMAAPPWYTEIKDPTAYEKFQAPDEEIILDEEALKELDMNHQHRLRSLISVFNSAREHGYKNTLYPVKELEIWRHYLEIRTRRSVRIIQVAA